MQIIISPAKKMRVDNDDLSPAAKPFFLKETETLLARLRQMSYTELQQLWQCNAEIAALNHRRLQNMELHNNLTPAVLAYDGIQYQYMAPRVFENSQLDYVAGHLNILSGFYGILKAMDGVVPYRLEMQAKLKVDGCRDLYEFWGDKIYQELIKNSKTILNLASKEYSKAIEKYLTPDVRYVTCIFGVLQDGKVKVKATEAKMARGEMVRWCSEQNIINIDEVKGFDRLGYMFQQDRSNSRQFVFVKN